MPYALIKADEDGNPVNLLAAGQLQNLLDNSVESYGVKEFKSLAFLQANPDPNYGWGDGVGVLIRYEVVVPVAVTQQWELG